MQPLLSMLLPLLLASILASEAAAAPAPAGMPSRPTASSAVQDAAPAPKPAFDAIHAPWTAILSKRVHGGDFDYAGLVKERSTLDAYLAALEAVRPDDFSALTKKEQFAFWINVYNAYTVKRVVDGYPVKSIRDLGDDKLSVWDRELVPLGRLAPKLAKEKLTLNDVENRILRPTFQDARLHAAVNCASKGCPPLRAEAFTGAQLDAQLDEQVKAWLADASRNRFDRSRATIEVSKVFEWFAEDFQREAVTVRGWIARFRPADAAWLGPEAKVEVKYVEYDWALNEARR